MEYSITFVITITKIHTIMETTTIEFRADENKAYTYRGRFLIATLDFNSDTYEDLYGMEESENDYHYNEMAVYSEEYVSEIRAELQMGFNF